MKEAHGRNSTNRRCEQEEPVLNKWIATGRLTRDPEIRQDRNGNPIARYSIAVDRRFSRDSENNADFFNLTSFGKTAEFAERYLKKGTKVMVEGELRNDNYTNKDGVKVYGTQVVVNNVEFCESKGSESQAPQAPQVDADGFQPIPEGDESLPFV